MTVQSTRQCNSNKHTHKSLGTEHVYQRVLTVDHHHGMYQRNRWISLYHRSVLKHAVSIARLSMGMSILDYGCCRQVLKQMLPSHIKYTGYDIDPNLSDIQDPRGGRYDVVFAVQVLHLIDREGLEKIVSNFADITTRVVVMLPSRNAFKRYVLDALLGLKKAADATFLSEPGDVYKAMQVKFHRESFSKFPLLAEFSVWHRCEHRDM